MADQRRPLVEYAQCKNHWQRRSQPASFCTCNMGRMCQLVFIRFAQSSQHFKWLWLGHFFDFFRFSRLKDSFCLFENGSPMTNRFAVRISAIKFPNSTKFSTVIGCLSVLRTNFLQSAQSYAVIPQTESSNNDSHVEAVSHLKKGV